MYCIEYGDSTLYSPLGDDAVYDATLTRQSVNAYDYLEFTMPADHALIDVVAEKDERVRLYAGSKILFDGYIEEIKEDIEGSKSVTCVSCMAYLEDTLVRPYTTGKNGVPSTVDGFLSWLITQHNANTESPREQFHMGRNQAGSLVSGNTLSASNSQLPTTREEITSVILDDLGGYLVVRYESSGNWLDFYADVSSVNAQIIDFGVNLADFTRSVTVTDTYTAVRPVGANSVTLSSLSNGTCSEDADCVKRDDVVYSRSAVERYGYRELAWECSTATSAKDLLSAAIVQLRKVESPSVTIEASAVDMALVGEGYEHLTCGQAVRVRSKPNGIDEYLIVQGIELDLQNPENTVFTLGVGVDSLTGNQSSKLRTLNIAVNSQADKVEALAEDAKTNAASAAAATAQANAALDAATSKSRIFASQPVPPYDQGDMWAQGENGDLLICLVSKAAGESYDPDDWVLATQYASLKAEYDAIQAAAEEAKRKAEALENGLRGIDNAADLTQNAAYLVKVAADAAAEASAKANESLAKIEDDIGGIKDAAAATDENLKGVTAELEGIEGKIQDVEDDVATAKADIASVPAKIEAAKNELTGQIESMKTEMEATYAKSSDVSSVEAALKSEIESSASDIRQTLAADYAMETELTDVKTSLQSQIDQSADQVTQVVQSVTDTKYRLDATRAILESAYADVLSAQAVATIAASNLADAEAYLDQVRQAAADALDASEDAQTALDDAAAALDDAAEAYITANGYYQDILENDLATETDIESAKAKMEDMLATYYKARDDAASAAEEAARAKVVANACQSAIEPAKEALAQVQANVDAANAAVKAAQDAADKAQADVDALKDTVSEQQTQINQNTEAIELRATKSEAQSYATSAEVAAEQYADAQLKIQSDRIDSTIQDVSMLGSRMSAVEQTTDGFSVVIDDAREKAVEKANEYTDEQVICGTNLIIASELVHGAPDSSGTMMESSTYYTSDYIDCEPGNTVILQTWREDSSAMESVLQYLTYYDDEKSYLGGYDALLYATSHTTVTGKVPAKAQHVCATFASSIKKYKLEIGTKPTAWSPAPEDLLNAIDGKASSEAVNQLDDTLATVSDSLADTKDDVKTISVALTDMQSSMRQTSESFDWRFDQIETTVQQVGDSLDATQTELSKWMTFKDDGTLHLGATPEEGGDSYELVLSNNSIDFVQNDKIVAYINNNKMQINESVVLTKLRVGAFEWQTRASGAMGLSYMG